MKTRNLFITAAILCQAIAMAAPVSAENNDTFVTVTIADAGKLTLTAEKILVTDTDGDGTLTVNDALYAAHETYYTGGAAAGYLASNTDWGLSLMKLWGVENGGSYGYTVNNVPSMSLSDPIQNGDSVYAYAYKDTQAYSDQYSYFDVSASEINQGDSITLTLTALGYDENWNRVQNPVADAVILVDGKKTEYKTDKDGKATISLTNAGTAVISAASDTQNLVPPICIAVVAPTIETTTTISTTTTSTTTTTTTKATTKSTSTTTAAAAKTGDQNAVPALAVTGILAGVAAVLLKKRDA